MTTQELVGKEVYTGTHRGWVLFDTLSLFERELIAMLLEPSEVRDIAKMAR